MAKTVAMLLLLSLAAPRDATRDALLAKYLRAAETVKRDAIDRVQRNIERHKPKRVKRKLTKREARAVRETRKKYAKAKKIAKTRIAEMNAKPAHEYYPSLDISIGSIGRLRRDITIRQIVDSDNMTVSIYTRRSDGVTFWMRGIPTGTFADDQYVRGSDRRIDKIFYVSGNKTYKTILGGRKTLLVVSTTNLSKAMSEHVKSCDCLKTYKAPRKKSARPPP